MRSLLIPNATFSWLRRWRTASYVEKRLTRGTTSTLAIIRASFPCTWALPLFPGKLRQSVLTFTRPAPWARPCLWDTVGQSTLRHAPATHWLHMLATVMSWAGQWKTATVYGNSLSGPLTRSVPHIIEHRVLYIYSTITLAACLDERLKSGVGWGRVLLIHPSNYLVVGWMD